VASGALAAAVARLCGANRMAPRATARRKASPASPSFLPRAESEDTKHIKKKTRPIGATNVLTNVINIATLSHGCIDGTTSAGQKGHRDNRDKQDTGQGLERSVESRP